MAFVIIAILLLGLAGLFNGIEIVKLRQEARDVRELMANQHEINEEQNKINARTLAILRVALKKEADDA